MIVVSVWNVALDIVTNVEDVMLKIDMLMVEYLNANDVKNLHTATITIVKMVDTNVMNVKRFIVENVVEKKQRHRLKLKIMYV